MSSKKAVLVGINYLNDSAKLYGCINDIVNVSEVLIDAYGYSSKDITFLRDDSTNPSERPTRANIIAQLTALVAQSGSLSEIWFHYSGHGSQVRDTTGDEADGLDEVLVPVDYRTAGMITDDMIFDIVKNSKCKTMLIFDSCHSGSICDLQWSFEYVNGSFSKTTASNKRIANSNIVSFSGCKDPQTSADAYSTVQQQGVGAFTDTFIQCLRANNHNVSILKLYSDICVKIKRDGFTQTPLLSCSSVVPSYIFTRVGTQTKVSTALSSISSSSVNTKSVDIDTPPTSIFSNNMIKLVAIENENAVPPSQSINYTLPLNTRRSRGSMGNMLDRL
jgi:hypothetical protein